MVELHAARAGLVEPLLRVGYVFPEAVSVVEGTNPGRIWVDDERRPRSALIWSPGIEGCYLVGDEHNQRFLDDLARTIDEAVAPQLPGLGVADVELSGATPAWDAAIDAAFGDRELDRETQCVYRPAGALRIGEVDAGRDHALRYLDEEVLVDRTLSGLDFVESKLRRFWETTAEFLRTGVGVIAVDEAEIVSLCLSAFVGRDVHSIDIETVASHRRRGCGEAVAQAFLAECSRRGVIPHWDCTLGNVASVALAEELGLSRVFEYTLYSFPLTDAGSGT